MALQALFEDQGPRGWELREGCEPVRHRVLVAEAVQKEVEEESAMGGKVERRLGLLGQYESLKLIGTMSAAAATELSRVIQKIQRLEPDYRNP